MRPPAWRVARSLVPERLRAQLAPLLGRWLDRLGVPPPGLRAGHGAPGGADRLPTVLVLHFGAAAAEAVVATVDALLAHGPAVGGPRPVLVLDTPHLGVARRAGLAVEHVLPAAGWAERHPDLPYQLHLAERLEQLCRDYATRHLVTVPAGGPGDWPDGLLPVLLRPPVPSRARRAWQRGALRLESAIDRPGRGA